MSDDLKKITIYLNKGVNRDAPPGSLEEGYASDLRHMGFEDNVCFKLPGIGYYAGAAAGSQMNGIYALCTGESVWGATMLIIRGTITKVSSVNVAGGVVTFTPTFTGALYDRWSFASWGNQLLLTNGIDKAQKLVSPYAAGDLTDMSADANCPKAHVVRTFQRHTFLLGQPAYPFRVSWSDLDDYTDWTAVATNDAGSIDLYESKTGVVGGDTLKTIFVAYTASQIHTFQYVGGAYVFARNIADYSTGLLSRDLLVSTEEAQFFMSPTNFFAFDGNKPQPIGAGIRKEVYAAMMHAQLSHSALMNYAFAFHRRDKGEVWFCVPTNSTYPDLACIFNYRNGAWSFDDFTAGALACAGADTWIPDRIYLALSDGYVYGHTDTDGKFLKGGEVAYTGYIDTPEFDGGDPEAVKHILKIVPDITASGTHTIGFRVGTRDTQNSAITWTPPLVSAATAFDPDSDKHVDVRVSGRLGRIRIETSALSSPFQVNKITIHYSMAGGR